MNRIDYWFMRAAAITWLVLGRRVPALALFDRMLARWPDDVYALASRANLRVHAAPR